jgi:hypothetical protein
MTQLIYLCLLYHIEDATFAFLFQRPRSWKETNLL